MKHRPIPSFVRRSAFTLVEVVLAIGIVSFAIVAILGVLPAGFSTSRSGQNETRAALVAETLFETFASQNFSAVSIKMYDTSGQQSAELDFNLTTATGGGGTLYANNSGQIIVPDSNSPPNWRSIVPIEGTLDTTPVMAINLTFDPSPGGFTSGYANNLEISVGYPANAAPSNQTIRYFSQIISRF